MRCNSPTKSAKARQPEILPSSKLHLGRPNLGFSVAIFLLLIGCSNIFLINQRLCLSGTSGNLFGLRDISLLGVILFGLKTHDRWASNIEQRPLWKICLIVLLLTAIGFLRALFDPTREIRYVGAELVGLIPWIIPIFVANNIRSWKSFKLWAIIIIAIGIIVSVASMVESRIGLPIVTGSASHDSLTERNDISHRRSTPSCWPLMMIAGSFLMATITEGSRLKKSTRFISLCSFGLVVIASLLTQSRTLLVGLASSALGLIVVTKRTTSKIISLAVLIFLLYSLPILLSFVPDLNSSMYLTRYSVLSSTDRAMKYAPTDGRAEEIAYAFNQWNRWIWFGVGISGEYRAAIYGDTTSGQMAHNILLFFATRFGLFGVIAFLIFAGLSIESSWSIAKRPHSREPILRLGLFLTSINLITCSQFGNIYASPYMSPVSMLIIGLTLSADQLTISDLKLYRANRIINQQLSIYPGNRPTGDHSYPLFHNSQNHTRNQ